MFRKVKSRLRRLRSGRGCGIMSLRQLAALMPGARSCWRVRREQGKSFKARYNFCLKGRDYNGAREAVATAGGESLLEPEEQDLMVQEVDFKGDG